MRLLILFTLLIFSCDFNNKKDQSISLNVNSTPPGAVIYIDDINTGYSTPHLFEVEEEKTMSVKLVLNVDYPEFTESIQLEQGDHKTINASIKAFWENQWTGDVLLENTNTSFELPFQELTVPSIANAEIRITYQWTNIIQQGFNADAKVRFNGVSIADISAQSNILIIPQSALIRNSTGSLLIDNSASTIAKIKITEVLLYIN